MVSLPSGMRAPDPKLSPFSKPMHLMGTHLAARPLITDPADLQGWDCCQFRVGRIHFTYAAFQRLGSGSGLCLFVSIPRGSADGLACEINAIRRYPRSRGKHARVYRVAFKTNPRWGTTAQETML